MWWAGVAVLVVAGWWSSFSSGWYPLTRAGLFLLAAVALNHRRMRHNGSSHPWLKSLVFIDLVLLTATIWTLATGDPNAIESLAIFLVPILFVFLLLTGLVAVVGRLQPSHRRWDQSRN